MLKIIALLFALVLCFSMVNAGISLIKPFEQTLASGDQLELGKIAVGETLELIVSTDSGTEIEWNAMEINKALLPKNWTVKESIFYGETVGIKLVIPGNAIEELQNINVKVFNKEKPEFFEEFSTIIFVKSNLLSVQINNLKQETIVDSPVEYRVFLLNDSIVEHKVLVSSTLPSYWFKEKEIELKPKELKEVIVTVDPKTYGIKKFNFVIVSKLNASEIKSAQAELIVNPTLESKYSNSFYGLPFFSPTLFPYYLINSFISLIKGY